jgi:hypothetical protein
MYFVPLAVAVGFSMSAQAGTAVLTIYDGVNPLVSVTDNGLGDESGATGAVVVQTNMGVWNLTISSAITKPLVGSGTSPIMDISLQAYSTAGGSLTLTFSDINFGPATGTMNATVTGHTVSGAPASSTFYLYGDAANNIGGTSTLITSMPTTPLTPPLIESSSGPLTLPAPFSLTEVLSVSAGGGSVISVDGSFTLAPVPEPGIPALGALGVGGWIWFRMRNRRA